MYIAERAAFGFSKIWEASEADFQTFKKLPCKSNWYTGFSLIVIGSISDSVGSYSFH